MHYYTLCSFSYELVDSKHVHTKAQFVSCVTCSLVGVGNVAGGYPEDRQKVLDFFLKRPDLETPVEITKEQHRELAYKQLLAIVREAGVNPMKYLMEDPGQYFALLEAVGYIDMSLAIKLGVQFR